MLGWVNPGLDNLNFLTLISWQWLVGGWGLTTWELIHQSALELCWHFKMHSNKMYHLTAGIRKDGSPHQNQNCQRHREREGEMWYCHSNAMFGIKCMISLSGETLLFELSKMFLEVNWVLTGYSDKWHLVSLKLERKFYTLWAIILPIRRLWWSLNWTG